MHPENLHVGQWIAVTHDHSEDESPTPFDMIFGHRSASIVDGQPLKIVGISLPFAAVYDGKSIRSLDLREVTVQLLHRKYVQAMIEGARANRGNTPQIIPPKESGGLLNLIGGKTPKQKEDDGHPRCPMCKDRLAQKKSIGNDWKFFCRQCGFEGSIGKDAS